MDRLSFLSALSLKEIENIYEQYKINPDLVPKEWQYFFDGFDFAQQNYPVLPYVGEALNSKEFNVIRLINGYRERGHYFTQTNPVRARRKFSPTLDIENFGLTKADLQQKFLAAKEVGLENATLQEIIDLLQETYCRTIGVEYRYIRHTHIVEWLTEKMEKSRNRPNFTKEEKLNFLQKTLQATLFEQFLHRRFPGQKRFSLEGAEGLIPALSYCIESAVESGAVEFVIGMAHRGRLNVLANILGKPIKNIFAEFSNKDYEENEFLGDVKYHLGYVSEKEHKNITYRMTLVPNPSHLEAVNPVVCGLCRSKIDSHYEGDTDKVIPILIHGDASIAGQGVVYELTQMSELPAYRVGGSIHIVINNQIGFTTNYLDARSSIYCTDVAKIIQSPIFHVNADDIEAICYVMKFAVEYRQKFKKDIFIDLLCYRRYGHNESDEPNYTQPTLYKIIQNHPSVHEIYGKQLIENKVIEHQEFEQLKNNYLEKLNYCAQQAEEITKLPIVLKIEESYEDFIKAKEEDYQKTYHTSVNIETLSRVIDKITTIPENFRAYSKIVKLFEQRKKMFEKGIIDWPLAEHLVFGTLLLEGINIRLCGQDVERGTFSQRHAVIFDEETADKYIPLNNLSPEQAKFEIYNSLLSEYAALGFEYGYALGQPNNLTIWEAQFGDFANGAQIIIDQFIMSAEMKWNVSNNLVLFLPHGYEGQGPEHSSARIERFLIMAANLNVDILQCSTPANFFHALRRHIIRPFRKPLIMFTPKSLLRSPLCVSSIDDFTRGSFKEVIDDEVDKEKVNKVVVCSGRIFYDLLSERQQKNINEVALIRVEQLYPFPIDKLKQILNEYKHAKTFYWVQDEPANMGAWFFVSRWLKPHGFKLIARPMASSPATGSFKLHKLQQQKILEKTFGDCVCNKNYDECFMVCLFANKDYELL